MGTLSLGFSEKLIMRFGPRTTLIPGVAMIGVGLLLFARTPVDGNYLTDLLPPLLLVGVGVGTSFPSLMTLAMSGAGPSEAGLASGVVNTSMQVGGAIGLAVLATLAQQRSDDLTAPGAKVTHAALNSGYHLAYVIGAVLVAAALVVAVTVLRQPSPAEMAEMAEMPDGHREELEPAEAEPAYEAG
jgi:MFS family permease